MEEQDAQRREMVEKQLQGRDIFDERVLEAMRRVPRHAFVPESLRPFAYQDRALSIGHDQTISQPYVVALMLQTLQLSGHENVLEIGTGSGYQTAILSELCAYVYSVERHPQLAEEAGQRLGQLGYRNVDIHVGDGSQGLPDMSPFDAIVVSACVPAIPNPLRGQLRPQNGRLILPVGNRSQQYLKLAVRDYEQWRIEQLIAVRFVPLIGRYGFSN